MSETQSRLPRLPGHFQLDARPVTRALSIAAVLATAVQVLLGADSLLLFLALAAGLGGLATFARAGAFNCGAWVVLCYVFGNVLLALWAKTLLGQPLESHLYDPARAFIAVGAGVLSMALAYAVAHVVPVGKPLFRPCADPMRLRVLSWGCFVLGVAAWYLNATFHEDAGGVRFGGLALFRDLLFMAVIARTALLLERSGGTRSLDLTLCVILGICAFVGFMDNSKARVALPVVSHFFTTLFFRRSLSLRLVGAFSVATLAFVLVVGPVIHVHRAMGMSEESGGKRIEVLERGLLTVTEGVSRLREREEVLRQFSGGYIDYFGGGYGQMLLGRYAMVQQVDAVVAQVARERPFGHSAILPALLRPLPRFLYPEKPELGEGYLIVARLGLIDPMGGKYPTVPLVAQAYAGYGALGLMTIPFLTFLAFLVSLKKLGWNLERNVYAIFFFCQFVVVHVVGGDLGEYSVAMLRGFPVFAALFIIMGQRLR